MARIMISPLAMYNADEHLFDNLDVPLGVNKVTLVETILYQTAELECLYPRPSTFKQVLGLWSSQRSHAWARMYQALTEDYDPLHNYDRHEEVSESTADEGSRSGSSTGSSSGQLRRTRAGFNDTANLVPDYQDNTTGSDTATYTAGDSLERTFSREAHLYGNIGVVTSMTMLREEIAGRQTDIYQIIADEFKQAFCLLIY